MDRREALAAMATGLAAQNVQAQLEAVTAAEKPPEMIVVRLAGIVPHAEVEARIKDHLRGVCQEAGWGDVSCVVLHPGVEMEIVRPVTFQFPAGYVFEKFEDYAWCGPVEEYRRLCQANFRPFAFSGVDKSRQPG